MFNQIKDGSLDLVGRLLAFFYSLPGVGGSYGLAIIMLTATVMILLMPLTLKATKSTIKMTQLQPKLRALQKEHKDDKQALNQEMMALYSENGVNPVGGCLPMLAQLPVFLILFNVLRGLTRRVSEKSYFGVADYAHSITGGTSTPGQTFDPKHLDKSSELYQDLAGSTEMKFGPFDLARDAWGIVQNDFLGSFPYVVLILFVVGSSYYQQRQVSARRGAVPDNPTPQQQTQQQLLRVLPLMSGVWSFLFPAGLVLYWATSNLFRIGQQAYITRSLYEGEGEGAALMKAQADELAAAAEDEAKPKKKKASVDAETANGSAEDDATSDRAARRAKNRQRFRSSNGSTDDLIGDGRPSLSSKSDSKSGSKAAQSSDDADGKPTNQSAQDREEAWARRRAQRTKTRESKKNPDGSSRTTPKGTKPAAAKKKRKK